MRKTLAVILAFVMLVGLVGCTLEPVGPNSSIQTPVGDSSVQLEESSEPEETSEPEESSKEEESSQEESSQEESSQEESSLEESSQEESQEEAKESIAAYLPIIEELTELYGEGKIEVSDMLNQEMLRGLAVVRLLDMDGDGTEELYCAYSEEGAPYINRQCIYVLTDEGTELIYEGPISNNGTDVSPMTRFIYKEDKIYLCVGVPFVLQGEYLTVNRESEDYLECAMEFTAGYMSDDGKFYVDGEEVSEEEYDERQAEFTEGSRTVSIWYAYGSEATNDANLETTKAVIARIRTAAA